MQKLSKRLYFKHEGEQYILYRGKHAMLLRVEGDGLVVVDHYGPEPDQAELDRLLKLTYKAFLFRD